jgi:hypothetical protein
MAAFALPILAAGGSLISGLLGASAAQKAANAQVGAAHQGAQTVTNARDAALGTQNDVYNTDQAALSPYQSAGKASLAQLASGTAAGGQFNSSPTGEQVLAQDPGYAFRLAQGQQALDRANAAGGSLGSGGALKQALEFGQDYASGEYGNAFNRYMQNRQANFSNLLSLAGLGQTANSQLIGAGSNYANESSAIDINAGHSLADLQTQAANAQASGYMGRANAFGGMVSGITNAAGSLPFGKMFGGGGASGSGQFDSNGNYIGE